MWIGNWKGSCRTLNTRAVAAYGRNVQLDQLRRAPREPARERAVRTREGLVHRCGEGQARALRGRVERNVVPRRDRRDHAVDAGEAPARAAAARGDPRWRHGAYRDRHTYSRRHES